jgi:hypothetical protein
MRRSRIALALVVVWLAGLEVLPNLHLALHDQLGEHTHVGDATVFVASHRHADGTTHELRRPRTAPDRLAHLAAALAHGRHSFAHHTAAMKSSSPPLLAPLPVDRPTVLVVALDDAAPNTRLHARPTARGPPDRST